MNIGEGGRGREKGLESAREGREGRMYGWRGWVEGGEGCGDKVWYGRGGVSGEWREAVGKRIEC